MPKLAAAARFALAEFGPLIVFWALAATLGVKPAILGSILFIVADAAWRWRKGLAFTRLYLPDERLTLVFGLIDLASTSPFMLKYEAVDQQLRRPASPSSPARSAKSRSCRRSPSSAAKALSPRAKCAPSFACSRSSGRLFLSQGRVLLLDGLDPADARGDGAALRDRKRQSRPHDRAQRHTGAAPVLSLPPPWPVAEAGSSLSGAPPPRRRGRHDNSTPTKPPRCSPTSTASSPRSSSRASIATPRSSSSCGAWSISSRDALIAVAPRWFGPRWFLVDAHRRRRHDRDSALRRVGRRPLPLEGSGGVRPVLRLRLDLVGPPRAVRAARGDGVLADALPVRLRTDRACLRRGVLGHRPRPHRPHPRRLPVVWRGVHSLAGVRHRLRLHALRSMDAAGLTDGGT